MTELSVVTGNSLFLASMVLGGGLLMVGLFFTGIDNEPVNFVMLSDSHILKWLGVAMLLAAFFIFWGSPLGAALSAWMGTLFAFFGAAFLIISDFFANPGDFKPLAWLFAALGLIMACYAAMTPAALGLSSTLGLAMFILFILISLGGFFGFWGLRIKLGWWRPAGVSLMLAGVVSLVISLLGLFATVGAVSL